MPSENPYLQQILAKLDELNGAWRELLTPPFSIREVALLIKALTQAAQAVINMPESGTEKHAAVKAAFLYLDNEFHLVEKIDSLIPLPIFLEPFDGPAIRGAIDLMIVAVCAGWKPAKIAEIAPQ